MKMDDNLIDDLTKIAVAIAVIGSFGYVIIEPIEMKFELLSVIGPFVGLIVGYYFKERKQRTAYMPPPNYVCDKCKK